MCFVVIIFVIKRHLLIVLFNRVKMNDLVSFLQAKLSKILVCLWNASDVVAGTALDRIACSRRRAARKKKARGLGRERERMRYFARSSRLANTSCCLATSGTKIAGSVPSRRRGHQLVLVPPTDYSSRITG